MRPAFATGHPLFAANLAADRIALEAETRLPRKDVPVVVYDAGEGLFGRPRIASRCWDTAMFVNSAADCRPGRVAGYEIFQDVNSYAKAFGELVESRRHTPSLPAEEVAALIANGDNIRILDVRRFDEYATMNIPGSVSVPGAELVLRARRPRAGSQDHHHRQLRRPPPDRLSAPSRSSTPASPTGVVALRNGTIGWTLARQDLEHDADRRGGIGLFRGSESNASDVAYRAGVRRVDIDEAAALAAQTHRTLYRFDVRAAEEYAAGHIPGFRHYPGGQLVQEIDMAAPVRGARILLTDNMGVRADMTASWLTQMGLGNLPAGWRL